MVWCFTPIPIYPQPGLKIINNITIKVFTVFQYLQYLINKFFLDKTVLNKGTKNCPKKIASEKISLQENCPI